MSWKKRLSVLSAAALLTVFTLSGCGSSNDAASGTANTGTTASSGKGLTGDFEVQYFVGGYGDAWWKKVVEEFQTANPDLKIKVSAGPKINDQMKPRWIGGNPPDFVYIDGAGLNARQMIEDGQLEDLTEWYKTAKTVDGDLISESLTQAPEDYSGKTYNIPLALSSWGIFWDKKLFADNNWKAPTDFDSFVAVSKEIKAKGITPFIHTGIYPYYINNSILYPAMVSANNDDFSILQKIAANDPEAFKSPAVMTALNQIVTMRDDGIIDPAAVQLNHTDSQMLFLQHKDAFIANGLWMPNEMSKDVPEGFDFGFMPSITQKPGGKSIAVTSTATVGVAAKAKNKEAAYAFIQFIFAKKQASQWAELSGAPSNIKGDISASNAPAFVKQAAEYLNSKDTIVVPTITFNADVEKAMNDATVALTIGTIDPNGWIERVSAAAQKAAN
ncbi:ABC transporter substrate-binding protein [Paenibacillus sp. CFBP13512]|uniref:ABC transporter substrate-binding protein n=1 Tax=Paenibacillus sp. CFBP13512 TaxID=2184007 RepID=UPI0010C05CFF|nr:extracellular solute-binding protein [Paenibacillus sp. CFBP13512]TKJ85712.1 ABC transporter substrate-binding protein [Paenibacillus sp. CFBP13512]